MNCLVLETCRRTYPQLTPEEPADDCDQGKAVAMAGPDWSDLSLSKMYYIAHPRGYAGAESSQEVN